MPIGAVVAMGLLKSAETRLTASEARLSASKSGWRGSLSNESSNERGYGYKWQMARKAYLLKNPLCVMCEAAGRVQAATVLDHITPHQGNQDLFWNQENWQGLCAHCHSSLKQKMEREK